MTAGPAQGEADAAARLRPLFKLRFPAKLRSALMIALGAAMLMWSAIVNGRPPVFADTALYYSQAEYLAGALGLPPGQDRVPRGDPTALPSRSGAPNTSITIDGARSPIYGLFLYGLERLGGLWLVAAAQAGVVAATLYLLFRTVTPALGDLWYSLWMAALSATTSAPFFASFIMPDVFGGVAGAASLVVLVYWDRLGRPGRISVVAVLVFCLAVHRANLVAVCGLALLCGLFSVAKGSREGVKRAAMLAGAGAAAWVLVAIAVLPIAHRAGQPVREPPFLTARVLADGPGWRYLQYACDHGRPLALCRFRNLPHEDSDTLLWSPRRAAGLFGVSDFATRLRLEAEQRSFVLNALAYDPLGQLKASAANVGHQLAMTDVQSPLADPVRYVDDGYWRRTSLMRIIPDARTCEIKGRCASKIPARTLHTVQDAAIDLSVLVLAGYPVVLALARLAGRSRLRSDDANRLGRATLLSLAYVLINAATCSILSAPVPRYQARLIWLMPAVALLVSAALTRSYRAESHGLKP